MLPVHSWCCWACGCPCTRQDKPCKQHTNPVNSRVLGGSHGGKALCDSRLRASESTISNIPTYTSISYSTQPVFLNARGIPNAEYCFFHISLQAQSGREHFLISVDKSGSCVGADQHGNTSHGAVRYENANVALVQNSLVLCVWM